MTENKERGVSTPESKSVDLRDRLDDLRDWSASRIEECRRQELKFGVRPFGSPIGKHPPRALVEAWTERRALQAVRRILGWDPAPLTTPAPTERDPCDGAG